jgi:hypothetical protein
MKRLNQAMPDPQAVQRGEIVTAAFKPPSASTPQSDAEEVWSQSLARMRSAYPSLDEKRVKASWRVWNVALTRLSLGYPDRKLDDRQWRAAQQMYLEALAPAYDDPDLVQAVMVLAPRRWRFWPTPGEIGEACEALARERSDQARRDADDARRKSPRPIEDKRPWREQVPEGLALLAEAKRRIRANRVVSTPQPYSAIRSLPGDAARALDALKTLSLPESPAAARERVAREHQEAIDGQQQHSSAEGQAGQSQGEGRGDAAGEVRPQGAALRPQR